MSSPPPPPNPATTTAAGNATADFFKSVARQRPRKHAHPAIYQTFYNHQPSTTTTPPFPPPPPQRHQQPPPPQLHSNLRTQNQQQSTAGGGGGGLLYPVASSGRGFLSKHQQQQPNSDQIANSDGFPPRPTSAAYPYAAVHRPYGFSNSDIHGQTSHQLVNPSNPHLQQTFIGSGTVMTTVSANPKVVGQASVADDNNLKSIRDKNGDDSFVIIRDRKVQVSEGSSLYAQCRSWLKNGSTLENQPQYVDCVKSLPKPLPASMVEPRKEDDIEIEEKTEDVEQLSAKELLQQHIKHAKKVRGRLRNQRLQRIERYKDRLALLLPPVVDQQPKNDPTS